MMSWEAVVDGYLGTLVRRGRAEGTVRAYRYGLHDFGEFLRSRGVEPRGISPDEIAAWQLDQARRLKPRSRQLSATAVREALRWAERHGYVPADLAEEVETPKAPRLLPRPLSEAHVDRIKSYLTPRRPHAPLMYWRQRALFFYLVTTTARVSEVLSLNRADIEEELVVVTQKGGTEHALWAPEVAMAAVWDYVRRRDDPHPAVFVTHGNPPIRRLTTTGVREAWHTLADQLRIPRFTTHQLRHTGATELLDAGVPAEIVAAHLGHHGLASVGIYAEVRAGRRQLAVDAMQERFTATKPEWQPVVIKGGRGRRRELY